MAAKISENEQKWETSAILASKENEPLWTVQDVAEYLRLKPETVRAMARRGELPSIKVGKRIRRYRISDIKNWLSIHGGEG